MSETKSVIVLVINAITKQETIITVLANARGDIDRAAARRFCEEHGLRIHAMNRLHNHARAAYSLTVTDARAALPGRDRTPVTRAGKPIAGPIRTPMTMAARKRTEGGGR
jgi:hypothetical protein